MTLTATVTTGGQGMRRLGNSDMELSAIGFGAWAIGGGDYQYGWGSQADADSIGAIHKALELGVNWIDTAAVYGLGHSEEMVGRALREWTGERPYVFTKCERVWNEQRQISGRLKAESVREECEQSLRRLGVEALDLYQIHWPEPDADIEEGWGELQRLKEEGKIRWAGVSNFSVAQMERASKIAPVTSLQPPYSLVNRTVEQEILPYCERAGVGVIVYSPMQSGLLTGAMTKERIAALPEDDWRKKNPNFAGEKLEKNLALQELLCAIGKRHSVEAGVVAIAWTLRNRAVTAAIVGGRNAKQVEGVTPALALGMTDEEMGEIEAFVRKAEQAPEAAGAQAAGGARETVGRREWA